MLPGWEARRRRGCFFWGGTWLSRIDHAIQFAYYRCLSHWNGIAENARGRQMKMKMKMKTLDLLISLTVRSRAIHVFGKASKSCLPVVLGFLSTNSDECLLLCCSFRKSALCWRLDCVYRISPCCRSALVPDEVSQACAFVVFVSLFEKSKSQASLPGNARIRTCIFLRRRQHARPFFAFLVLEIYLTFKIKLFFFKVHFRTELQV